jgi:hypothetical protein
MAHRSLAATKGDEDEGSLPRRQGYPGQMGREKIERSAEALWVGHYPIPFPPNKTLRQDLQVTARIKKQSMAK